MTTTINHPWQNGGDPSSKPEVIVLTNGHVLITSDADTDADGSPDADQIDPSGQKETALGIDNGWQGESEYVNARNIPYFVLPDNWYAITNVGHHEKSALPRLLANADAGQDMSLSRYFQGKPVFFVVPC